jgi:hypothetical protein
MELLSLILNGLFEISGNCEMPDRRTGKPLVEFTEKERRVSNASMKAPSDQQPGRPLPALVL